MVGKRILSLDVFRGLTVVFMIIVNNAWMSKSYSFLSHAPWEGATLADLIFPAFIFIVGASIWFSFGAREESLTPSLVKKILFRGLKIFIVGVLLNWFPFYDEHISELRIPGVLQRIAIAYVIGSFLILWLRDVKSQIIAVAVILIGYSLLIWYYGGYVVEGNPLFSKVDVALFGASHLNSPARMFDPEGIVGNISAVATVLLGVLGARVITSTRNHERLRVVLMIIYGLLMIGIAYLASFMGIPIIKNLWTASYVLFTAGWAMIIWGVLFYIIDYKDWNDWAQPFKVFGVNAISAYVLAWIVADLAWHFKFGEQLLNLYGEYMTPEEAMLAWCISLVFICWVILMPLYKKKIYIKL